MRRLVLATLAAAFALLPSTMQAQIGGRIRGVVSGVAHGQQGPAATQIVVVPITPQLVSSYQNALKARDQEMQRLAHENSPTGRYFAGRLLRDSIERRRNDYKAQVGPDWARYQQLNAALQHGDTTAVSAIIRLQGSLDAQVDIPPSDWNTQQAGNAHMDTVMMKAAGLSAGEWAYTNDEMLKLVGLTANFEVSDDSAVSRVAQNANVTPPEVRAVAAKRIELARTFAYSYRTDAQLAQERADNSQQPSSDAGGAAGGANMKYATCLQTELKPMTDEAERRKAEFEAAQKSGDMSKVLEFTNRFMLAQQAAGTKCGPLLNH